MKHPDAAELGVSRETLLLLEGFTTLLLRWNAHINLVADRDAPTLWRRHIQDSLQLTALLPDLPGPLVDLGSGAGFPGLILALSSGRETHLVEADRRKAAFLQEAGRTLDLRNLRIHAQRIEAATLPQAAILTARALAPLADLLPHAHRILHPSGCALFPKGRNLAHEVSEAEKGWTMQTERFPSQTDPTATILRLHDIAPRPAHG